MANATTGLWPGVLARDLLEEVERQEPSLPAPWRPTTEVPPVLDGVLGVWHWGNTPYVVSLDADDLVLTRNDAVVHRFALRDDRLVGTEGYHAGETLHVVRREDGSVSHLECATFVYTRTPYDPEAPVPGR
jgi:D-alanyl-D-alanine carboxypeptidase